VIGHFLATLQTDEEDRALTQSMSPGRYLFMDGSGCLVGTTVWRGDRLNGEARSVVLPQLGWEKRPFRDSCVEHRYDNLCSRFGIQCVNAAIRNRILANRAYRALRNSPPVSREALCEVPR
jgi:hypothetical protein